MTQQRQWDHSCNASSLDVASILGIDLVQRYHNFHLFFFSCMGLCNCGMLSFACNQILKPWFVEWVCPLHLLWSEHGFELIKKKLHREQDYVTNLSHMPDHTITRSWIGYLVSLPIICDAEAAILLHLKQNFDRFERITVTLQQMTEQHSTLTYSVLLL